MPLHTVCVAEGGFGPGFPGVESSPFGVAAGVAPRERPYKSTLAPVTTPAAKSTDAANAPCRDPQPADVLAPRVKRRRKGELVRVRKRVDIVLRAVARRVRK